MSSTKKVAVVILSWNGRKYLEKFLPSVMEHTSMDLCDVFIADNGSTDGSVEYVKENFPFIKVIVNSRNGGYAGGYNDALPQIQAEYFVLLNQDVEVTCRWVEKVIAEMEKDNKIAAAQPKLRDNRNRERFEYAGAAGGYLDKYSYAYCRGRLFDELERDEEQYDNVADIFWATGACFFIRSSIFFESGGFDEDFFAHQEEIDLCWRLRSRGYKVICVPQSVIYHVGGGSLPQGNPRKIYLNFRNNLMMMFKNLPLAEMIWKVFFVRTFMDGLAALHSIYKRKAFSDFTAIIKAQFAFCLAIPALIKKRKTVGAYSSLKSKSSGVVWQFFVQGKRRFSELE